MRSDSPPYPTLHTRYYTTHTHVTTPAISLHVPGLNRIAHATRLLPLHSHHASATTHTLHRCHLLLRYYPTPSPATTPIRLPSAIHRLILRVTVVLFGAYFTALHVYHRTTPRLAYYTTTFGYHLSPHLRFPHTFAFTTLPPRVASVPYLPRHRTRLRCLPTHTPHHATRYPSTFCLPHLVPHGRYCLILWISYHTLLITFYTVGYWLD